MAIIAMALGVDIAFSYKPLRTSCRRSISSTISNRPHHYRHCQQPPQPKYSTPSFHFSEPFVLPWAAQCRNQELTSAFKGHLLLHRPAKHSEHINDEESTLNSSLNEVSDNVSNEKIQYASSDTSSPNASGNEISTNQMNQDNENMINVTSDKNANKKRALGIFVLLTVPLAWGTYTPVVKYMYDKMDPSMPGFVFSAGYYLVAALSLNLLSLFKDKRKDLSLLDTRVSVQNDQRDMNDNGKLNDYLEEENAVVNRGGWELGSYLFIGNGLQVVSPLVILSVYFEVVLWRF